MEIRGVGGGQKGRGEGPHQETKTSRRARGAKGGNHHYTQTPPNKDEHLQNEEARTKKKP